MSPYLSSGPEFQTHVLSINDLGHDLPGWGFIHSNLSDLKSRIPERLHDDCPLASDQPHENTRGR